MVSIGQSDDDEATIIRCQGEEKPINEIFANEIKAINKNKHHSTIIFNPSKSLSAV